MVGQHGRRCANSEPTLGGRFVGFSGLPYHTSSQLADIIYNPICGFYSKNNQLTITSIFDFVSN